MKKIGIFGSTGSVGAKAVEIALKHADKLRVSVLACGGNTELLRQQVARLAPETAVVGDARAARAVSRLAKEFPKTAFLTGEAGLSEAARDGDFELMLNALSGTAGLIPTWRAIRAGKNVALANKESVVAAGELIMAEARARGVTILPVDSEHSAIFQALEGRGDNPIRRLVLTASGGPFRGRTRKETANVTPAQALNHPNWVMGRKISVDSATMMNKGLELIEARWLFDVPERAIEVAVHPQSIIHSMAEFEDGSVLAQMGTADMRVPISYALSYPARWDTDAQKLDFRRLSDLTFEPLDENAFPCVATARAALRRGMSYPTVLNAANEALVGLFLDGRIGFNDIADVAEKMLDAHTPCVIDSVETAAAVDRETKARTAEAADHAGSSRRETAAARGGVMRARALADGGLRPAYERIRHRP